MKTANCVFNVLKMGRKFIPSNLQLVVHLHYYLFILFPIYIPRCLISVSPCGVGTKSYCFSDLKS